MKKELPIEFIQELFDISWELLDFVRDKRVPVGDGHNKAYKPKKGIARETLQAIVNLNAITSNVLTGYNKPDDDFEGEIPTTVIDTIEL